MDKTEMKVKVKRICPDCNGHGELPNPVEGSVPHMLPCKQCKGTREVEAWIGLSELKDALGGDRRG